MSGHVMIGVLLITTALVLTFVLTRFFFIKENSAVLMATVINPGLVGLFAGSAFITKSLAPTLTKPLLFIALGLILLSLPILIIFVPRAILEQQSADRPGAPDSIDENND